MYSHREQLTTKTQFVIPISVLTHQETDPDRINYFVRMNIQALLGIINTHISLQNSPPSFKMDIVITLATTIAARIITPAEKLRKMVPTELTKVYEQLKKISPDHSMRKLTVSPSIIVTVSDQTRKIRKVVTLRLGKKNIPAREYIPSCLHKIVYVGRFRPSWIGQDDIMSKFVPLARLCVHQLSRLRRTITTNIKKYSRALVYLDLDATLFLENSQRQINHILIKQLITLLKHFSKNRRKLIRFQILTAREIPPQGPRHDEHANMAISTARKIGLKIDRNVLFSCAFSKAHKTTQRETSVSRELENYPYFTKGEATKDPAAILLDNNWHEVRSMQLTGKSAFLIPSTPCERRDGMRACCF